MRRNHVFKILSLVSFMLMAATFNNCAVRPGFNANVIDEAGSSRNDPTSTPTYSGNLPILTSSKITTAAQSFCSNPNYPTQNTWDPAQNILQDQPATSGTPKIEQYRNGQLIATWQYLGKGTCGGSPTQNISANPQIAASAGCGPFGRSHFWRSWRPGDLFLVYPAVYNANDDANQPWIGPQADNATEYSAGTLHIPTNLTIRGVSVNGVRPVLRVNGSGSASNTTLGQGIIYLDHTVGMKIENIDIDTTGVANRSISRAGIYVVAARDLTLSKMRIRGLQYANANGILGTGKGTWNLDQMEFYQNGGLPDSAAHNVYISQPATNSVDFDPNFTVRLTRSWTHDAYYGHAFKSRAANNYIEGNYFQGGLPQTSLGLSQADNYLLDLPNGGVAVVKNNIFVKNRSGANSNGMSFTYAMEGIPDNRSLSLDVQNNTFVTHASTYDGSHLIYPMHFFYPGQVPTSSGFPVSSVTVKNNLFVGYCPQNNAVMDYRGQNYMSVGFTEVNKDFSLKSKYVSQEQTILGRPKYTHQAQGSAARTIPTIGAQD